MSKVIITVNGKPILERDYLNTLNGFALNSTSKHFSELDVMEQENLQALAQDKLISRELLFEEALARGIVPTQEEVETEINKIISAFPSPDAFEKFLTDSGIAAMEYYRMARQDLAVNQLQDLLRCELPESSPEAIAEFHQTHGESLMSTAKVRVRHLLIQIEDDDRSVAVSKIEQLKTEAHTKDFAELARLHSQCPSSANGGDLGFIQAADIHPAFAEVAFQLEIGAISDVVETPFGLHLIKLEERQDSRPLTVEEAIPKIQRMMTELALAKQLQVMVARLKSLAQIEHLN